jgi:predicted TIM-barrel fold metal-dependent hydrolase
MIIDSHTHIREGKGEVKKFLYAMDQNDIDMAIVHPIVPGDEDMGYCDNAFVAKLVKTYPDRLMGYACVVPTEADASCQLRRAIEDYGLLGLKLHPPLQNFSLEDPRVSGVIETCIMLDIPILIHTGPIYSQSARLAYSSSLPIDDLAIRYPEAKFIIAHADPFGLDPVLVAKHPNVYFDTTIVFSRWVKVIPEIGPATIAAMRTDERILFGTDANPLKYHRFEENLAPLKAMAVSEEVKEKMFYGNIKRLLKLN